MLSSTANSSSPPCFLLFCQAHDIIVVELAPPPPREATEADSAVDPDAAVAVVVPKVPEKKKVMLKYAWVV